MAGEGSSRLCRLQQAASGRLRSVCVVLEGWDQGGDRAALMRSAECIGLLHVHEVRCTRATKAHQASCAV